MSWLNHFLQAHGSGSEQAIDQLQQQGLPHRRLEPWRFTDIAPLTGLTPALLKPRERPKLLPIQLLSQGWCV
ncbi:hypothetical protein AAF134_13035 [Synechococcus lacustris Tous-12m]